MSRSSDFFALTSEEKRDSTLVMLRMYKEERHRRKDNFVFPVIAFNEADLDVSEDDLPNIADGQNRYLDGHKSWISRAISFLRDSCYPGDDELEQLRLQIIQDMTDDLEELNHRLLTAWRHQRLTKENKNIPEAVNCDRYHRHWSRLQSLSGPLLLCLITPVILHLLSGTARPGSNFLLVALKVIVASSCTAYVQKLGLKRRNRNLEDPLKLLGGATGFPDDVRTAMEEFDFDPDITQYACCPKCFSLYPPAPSDPGSESYPNTCTFEAFPGEMPCGADLLQEEQNTASSAPIMCFCYQPLESWLARIISRPSYIDRLRNIPSIHGDPPSIREDVYHGSVYRSFRGDDGKLFFDCPDGELRLGFSLNIDWFNPFGRKQAGKHSSVGTIYMVCMNLPIYLRYRMENVYLAGIIPGPNEPDIDSINHLLRPLVDSLVKLWTPGVQFRGAGSGIYSYHVRCALLTVVSDLPALRKVTGFVSYTANQFCSFCKLPRQDICNFDCETWERRTRKEHLVVVWKYRNASSRDEQLKEVHESGVRWSELWRLPYWDPTRYAVLDSMHNLFLGILQTHCRVVWGMDSSIAPDKRMGEHSPKRQKEEIDKLLEGLKTLSRNNITPHRKTYLQAFIRVNNVPMGDASTKKELIEALMSWRKSHPSVEIRVPEASTEPIFNLPVPGERPTILDQAVLREVMKDINNTSFPSWLMRPPQGLGTRKGGKLVADQWRTLCTVSLVITLVRLWGRPQSSARKKALLENYVALITAIRWGTMRSVSDRNIEIVEKNIHFYLTSFVSLFSAEELKPNHHLSMHLVECMKNFGPVHGWWTFAFERYNGIIQRFNTNNRFSKLELTFITTFCRAGNLKNLMTSDGIPEILEQLKPAFQHHFGTELKGTLTNDLLALGASGEVIQQAVWDDKKRIFVLSDAEYNELLEVVNKNTAGIQYSNDVDAITDDSFPLSFDVQVYRRLRGHGIVYCTVQESRGNSQILFKSKEGIFTGKIVRIFTHKRSLREGYIVEYFLTVKKYCEISSEDAGSDPYRRFALLQVQLTYTDVSEDVYVICEEDIICHIATCPYNDDAISRPAQVVVSLQRNQT